MECLKDIAVLVQATCAVALAVCAGMALDTWRRQLKGQTRFDTAKRLLIASHALAQKFHNARSAPLIIVSDSQRSKMKIYADAMSARSEPLGKCVSDVEGLIPEARGLLSDAVADAANGMVGCTDELKFAMFRYVMMAGTDQPLDSHAIAGSEADLRQAEAAIFADPLAPGGEDHELPRQFKEHQRALIAALKPFIEME
jgi:hypothetical protein